MPIHALRIERCRRLFIGLSGILLALSGAAKLVSAFGSPGILAQIDPIIAFSNRRIFLGAGLIEIWVAWRLLARRDWYGNLAVIGALGLSFLAYRVIHGLARLPGPCPCLGNAWAWWPWLAQHENWIGWLLAGFLAIGSSALMGVELLAQGQAAGGESAANA
jgi:hypothetical protein